MDINSVNVENINTFTYKELIKLSAKYKIHKRWPKKDVLIKDILQFKEKPDTVEWKDANTVLQQSLENDENANPHRLTYNIDDSRATYTVPINESRSTFTISREPNETSKLSKITKLTVPFSPVKKRNLSVKSIGIRKAKTTKPVIEKTKVLKTINELVVPGDKSVNRPTLLRRKSKSYDGTPITPKQSKVKKIPNFAKIHEKEFSKMQSLDEYVEQKKKRARMMSAPMILGKRLTISPKSPVIKQKTENISTPIKKPIINTPNASFSGQYSKIILKDSNVVSEKLPLKTPIKGQKGKTPLKTPVKMLSCNKSKPRSQSEIKLNTKNVINGIRSNRRFELQMKFRNLV